MFQKEKSAGRGLRFLDRKYGYFLGALWVVGCPERTDFSDERESRMVSPTEVSIKMIAP